MDADNKIADIVEAIATKHFVVARPRLLCRSVVDLLDGQLGIDVHQSIAAISEDLDRRRAKEMEPEESV